MDEKHFNLAATTTCLRFALKIMRHGAQRVTGIFQNATNTMVLLKKSSFACRCGQIYTVIILATVQSCVHASIRCSSNQP